MGAFPTLPDLSAAGESLRAASDGDHAARAGRLQEHTVAMARTLGDVTSAVNNAGIEAQQQCCAGERTALRQLTAHSVHTSMS